MYRSQELIYSRTILPILFLLMLGAACSPSAESTGEEPPSLPTRMAEKIKLQPFGVVDAKHCAAVKDALESYYNCEVKLQESLDLPQEAWYAPRKRYRADSLLRFLHRNREEEYDRVIGITEKDISTTKPPHEDWGIMGLGARPGRVCVVSTFRMNKAGGAEEREMRLRKVAKHELGHTLGLLHCEDQSCFMRDCNGKGSTIDTASDELCGRCRVVVGRYLKESALP